MGSVKEFLNPDQSALLVFIIAQDCAFCLVIATQRQFQQTISQTIVWHLCVGAPKKWFSPTTCLNHLMFNLGFLWEGYAWHLATSVWKTKNPTLSWGRFSKGFMWKWSYGTWVSKLSSLLKLRMYLGRTCKKSNHYFEMSKFIQLICPTKILTGEITAWCTQAPVLKAGACLAWSLQTAVSTLDIPRSSWQTMILSMCVATLKPFCYTGRVFPKCTKPVAFAGGKWGPNTIILKRQFVKSEGPNWTLDT